MIEVKSDVEIYEVNNQEVALGAVRPVLSVQSHWNRPELIILKHGRKSITVTASDLEAAIENAHNTNRHG